MALTKVEVAWSGLLTELVRLIETEWNPGNLATELKYRDSLLEFLRSNLPSDTVIEKEYRDGGTTADIHLAWKGFVINSEVFIELKRNLQQKSAYDRLVGQIECLNPRKRMVVVALVGQSNAGLVGRLKERYPASSADEGIRIAIKA